MSGRRLVALVLVAALVLGGASLAVPFVADRLGGDDVRSGSGHRGAFALPAARPGSDEAPTPELERFYGQHLTWSSCRHDAWCATLTVPLDYTHPDGDTIDLAVLAVPATGDRQGALVVNPGGPGAPGTDYAAAAARVFRAPLRRAFDIVGFDPRGTGASAPVDCLSDGELDSYLAGDPDPDTPEEEQEYAAWNSRLGQGCVAHSGDLAAHVSTVESARDMDVLRSALGQTTLDYFGASYGTKLGATYADLFPDRAGRLVLDGAVDVDASSRQLSLDQAAGFETALRSYVSYCLDRDSCPLHGSVDDGLDQIRGLLDDVDRDPLPTGGDRELEVGNAFYGLVTPLYARQSWPVLTAALTEAFEGSGTTLLALADLYSHRRRGGGYSDNSAEAIYAINCLDDPWAVDPDEVAAQLPDFERASPTFGDVFAWMLTTCSGVEVHATEPAPDVTAAGAPPILVVGTTRDPATPYHWAQHLADQLASGVLLTRDGDGHTGYNSGNACVDSAVESFLVDGVVPDDGTSC